jgi:hypothetical protein
MRLAALGPVGPPLTARLPRVVRGVRFMLRGCNRAAAHNRILEEPAMAKARSLVGLDVHATKIVAAVLDAETVADIRDERRYKRRGRALRRLGEAGPGGV